MPDAAGLGFAIGIGYVVLSVAALGSCLWSICRLASRLAALESIWPVQTITARPGDVVVLHSLPVLSIKQRRALRTWMREQERLRPGVTFVVLSGVGPASVFGSWG